MMARMNIDEWMYFYSLALSGLTLLRSSSVSNGWPVRGAVYRPCSICGRSKTTRRDISERLVLQLHFGVLRSLFEESWMRCLGQAA